MSLYVQEGLVHISLCDKILAECNHHAVVGPDVSERPRWAIKAFRPPENDLPYYITLINSKDSEQVCLTLGTNNLDNEVNVMVEPLGTPEPKMSQLWTFWEVDNRSTLATLARIQSVARPWLSAAISGDLSLPYQNVIGVSNQPGSKSQLWMLDYTPLNQ